jgi:hypothetical protein
MLDLFDPKVTKYYCRDARASYEILHALSVKYPCGVFGNKPGDHWGVDREKVYTSQISPWENHYAMEIVARTKRDHHIMIIVKYFPDWRRENKNKAFIYINRVIPGYDWMSEIYETYIAPAEVESAVDNWVAEMADGQPPSNTKKNHAETNRYNLN